MLSSLKSICKTAFTALKPVTVQLKVCFSASPSHRVTQTYLTPTHYFVFFFHFFFLHVFIDAVYSEADRQTGAGARIQRHTITHTNTHMHASPTNGLRLVPAFTRRASLLFDTPDPFPLFFQSSSPSRPCLYVTK